MILRTGQRVVFIGDSITDCGRRDVAAPYGSGYVSLVRALVDARHPELELEWVNRGVGGDTVRDLAARWDDDAIGERPDWLAVLIGINDIWRHYGDRPDEAVGIEEYERTLRDLIRRAVAATGCRLILGDPFFIEADRSVRNAPTPTGTRRSWRGWPPSSTRCTWPIRRRSTGCWR